MTAPAGLEEMLQALREVVIWPSLYGEEAKALGLKWPRGVLLHGPPGTGKTMAVNAIARECGASLHLISASSICGAYAGESEARLRKVFEEAEQASRGTGGRGEDKRAALQDKKGSRSKGTGKGTPTMRKPEGSRRGRNGEASAGFELPPRPAIIFIDEIDTLCPKRDVRKQQESRIVAQLLTLMDGLGITTNKPKPELPKAAPVSSSTGKASADKTPSNSISNSSNSGSKKKKKAQQSQPSQDQGSARRLDTSDGAQIPQGGAEGVVGVSEVTYQYCGHVVVIGATNRPNTVDNALRRPGRFDREIAIPVPGTAQRREILESQSQHMPLSADVDLLALAEQCRGYVGADLAALCREAAMLALREEAAGRPAMVSARVGSSQRMMSARVGPLQAMMSARVGPSQGMMTSAGPQALPSVDGVAADSAVAGVDSIADPVGKSPAAADVRENGKGSFEASSASLGVVEWNGTGIIDINSTVGKPRSTADSVGTTERCSSEERPGGTGEEGSSRSTGLGKSKISMPLEQASSMRSVTAEAASSRDSETGEEASRSSGNSGLVCLRHFLSAMGRVGPSVARGRAVPEHPTLTWDAIGGLHSIKKKLQVSVQWPLLHSSSFARLGLSPPRGILLHGPPGSSKTSLALAAANAAKATLYSLSGADLFSMFLGEGETLLKETFHLARLTAPSIIFLDEIDCLAPKRSGQADASAPPSSSTEKGAGAARLLAVLLTEMDGVEEAKGVLLLAATNRLHALDSAMLRPGRFDVIIEIPKLDQEGRLEVLKVHTRNMSLGSDVDLQIIAEQAEGLSGADLAGLCRESALAALREDMDLNHVFMRHFLNSLNKTK